MSKKTDKNANKSQVEEVNPEVVDEEADSPWYYFYSQGCGWCKRSEPLVDELNKDRSEKEQILKLDLADPDNRALNEELKQEYGVQCGTPWFINEATGKGICGYREKDILEKWLDGEEIPAPPRPKGPIPKVPFQGASKKEENEWKEKYEKWLEENDHLPDNSKKSADEILSQPRPKSEPPRPPVSNASDEDLNVWAEKYDKWAKENNHLPNLQPGSALIQRFKQQQQSQQPPQQAPVVDDAKLNSLDAKVQALTIKVDKIMSHFGVK